MQTIRDVLSRDLSQPIEEVIKLDQQDEQTVYTEITEYVATDRIKEQYLRILREIADGPGSPTEGVGVWISGFFGSGKSSFAKNLGYVLANRKVLGKSAAQLFVAQLQQQNPKDEQVQQIAERVDYINKRFDAHVIMFDVQVDRAVQRTTEPIAEIMYTVLLRELDYAQDYDLAELEISLEGEGRLAAFVRLCAERYSGDVSGPRQAPVVPRTLEGVTPEEYGVWQMVRKSAESIQRASAVLNLLDPATHPAPDSWATSFRRAADISIRTLVDRTFELTARRQPGAAIIFIIDEVGQYVARSADKIENLRAVVEHFGQESKNRVLAGRAVAPVWVIVTSQEKLDEVVAAIGDKRVDIAKLQDRFRIRVDMAPSDIREVATRRVLAKKPEAEPVLRRLYQSGAALLKTHTTLEGSALRAEVGEDAFVQFYPYLPYFIDLSIDIVSGIRLQPGAPKHIGGSNRTIIKQAYEMLVSPRTALADAPLGALVSMDRIYDLVEGNLPTEKKKDIDDIAQRWPDDVWPVRVAKAIALLEYVRDLPRSDGNLAATLYTGIGAASPLADVQRATKLLEKHQFVRQTENGWKLQTAQEKSWAAERNAHNPPPRERDELVEEVLRGIFSQPALMRYHYGNQRTFRVGVTWDKAPLTSGDTQVPLELRVADGPTVFEETCEAARFDSRAAPHHNDIFWVMSLHDEIDAIVVELYRSRQMVAKYDRLRAQGKLTDVVSASLATEKTEAQRQGDRLKDLLEKALSGGRGYFRGNAKDGAALGKTLGGIFKAMFDFAVPDLYPKLEMGARPLKGDEAEDVLKAANLAGLAKVFYGPPDGLDLVSKEGSKYVVNMGAPIIKEVAEQLAREHTYGNKVTGKALEVHFGGLGYGWEREMIWLVLATLLRGGGIEVTYQGRRYRNHLDPQVRAVFTGTNAFRAASFAPRVSINLSTLVAAARRYEALTGEEVDVEEAMLAQAFQRYARAEVEALLPVEATVKAHHIPVQPTLEEYHTTLNTILNSASDDCVSILAGEGVTFQELRDRVGAIRKATSEAGLAALRRMRTAVTQIAPLLRDVGSTDLPDGVELDAAVQSLQTALDSAMYHPLTVALETSLLALENTYAALYLQRHTQRHEAFTQAVEAVKAQPNWLLAPDDAHPGLLKPLTGRACEPLAALPKGALTCPHCHASLAEMTSDLAAVRTLRSDVLMEVQRLTTPEEPVERVRVAAIAGVGRTLATPDDVDALIEALRAHLRKLVDQGVKVVLE